MHSYSIKHANNQCEIVAEATIQSQTEVRALQNEGEGLPYVAYIACRMRA